MPSNRRLHVVALAHLDTQWRWTVRDTVRDHLPATVAANERLFERFPGYVLSFEGAHRYRLLEEHHPALFETVRRRVREGRWAPAGAAVEAFDTLLPGPESILRQIVLGRRWFRERLGVDSRDLFLPDCFGFPATLPTLAVHAGVFGFSTQKLRRGELMRSAYGIPFAYGRWRGPDGSELLAALDPGEYSGRIAGELERDPVWLARFAELDRRGLPQRLMLYVGTGDRGGAPPVETIAALERALKASRASGLGEQVEASAPGTSADRIEVLHGASQAIYVATTSEERGRLPVYEGELLLRLHATGCYSAKAILKRWNRRVECVAYAAEAAAALAAAAGSPRGSRRTNDAWWRLLAHQMHDDLTGTSIPAAYRFSLDALGLAANELGEALLDAISVAAERLDRTGNGQPFALFSPLAAPRTELVEIELGVKSSWAAPAEALDAIGPDGEPAACQIIEGAGRRRVLVRTRFEGLELQTVRLVAPASRTAAAPPAALGARPVEVDLDRLENELYCARFDPRGRLASLFAKRLGRELLAGPIELELLPDRSRKYPAWEIQWRDLSAAPLDRIDRLAGSEVVERGPLRAALRFEHRTRGAIARTTWSLAAGADAGHALELALELDWRRRGRLLELRFPLAASSAAASYDTGLGAIARPVASEALYEVPAQAWAAIEDPPAGFGVAILTDVPRGWNQPDRSTLRTTLVHAPLPGNKFRHQAKQDRGRHLWRFALLGFEAGAVAGGRLAQVADRFQRPPLAFRVAPGGDPGAPRRATLFSLAPPVRLLALAPGQADGSFAARLSNPAALPAAPTLELAAAVAVARETDACGEPVEVEAGADRSPARPIAPSGLRTLEARRHGFGPDRQRGRRRSLLSGGARLGGPRIRRAGRIRARRRIRRLRAPPAAELAPPRIDDAPVPFDLSHLGGDRPDTALADGATVKLDSVLGATVASGDAELWLLCASVAGDIELPRSEGDHALSGLVPDWRSSLLVESAWPGALGFGGVRPGEFRRRPVVWSVGHLHDRQGDDLPVERASLFALRMPTGGSASVRLPEAAGVRIVAATLAFRPARIATEAFAWPAP